MRPCHWKAFSAGTLNHPDTGNCILVDEITKLKLAPTGRAGCKRCEAKIKQGELWVSGTTSPD